MEHEKVFRIEDGSRVKIKLASSQFSSRNELSLYVTVCDKGKRTWYIPGYYEYDYRSSGDRPLYLHHLTKDLYSEEMLMEVKTELADKIRDSIINLQIKNGK